MFLTVLFNINVLGTYVNVAQFSNVPETVPVIFEALNDFGIVFKDTQFLKTSFAVFVHALGI
jgi:hypothetical protein